jgi:hypothetical protein
MDIEKNALIGEYGPLFWANKNALKNGKIFVNAGHHRALRLFS